MARERERVLLCFICAISFVSFASSATTIDQQEQEEDYNLISYGITLTTTNKFKSRVLQPYKDVHCVSYYAKSNGKGTAVLGAMIQEADSTNIIGTLHQETIPTTERLFYFEIDEQKKKFVVVMGQVAFNEDSTLHIRDVEITEGHCLDQKGSCNFEKNTCEFSLDHSREAKWKRISANDEDDAGRKYPSVDSTIGSGEGHFLIVEVKDHAAQIVPPILKSDASCVRFQYSIVGKGQLEVGVVGTEKAYGIFKNKDSRRKATAVHWRATETDIALPDERSFRVFIKAVPSESGETWWAAIDDIEIKHRSCLSMDQHIVPKPPVIIKEGSCDFDSSCGKDWTDSDYSSGYKWEIRTGKNTVSLPNFDHTKREAEGKFLFIWVSGETKERDSIVRGPFFDRSEHDGRANCFSFWYFMHGNSVPRLSVSFSWPGMKSSQQHALWMREGDQGPSWLQAFVHIPDPGKNEGQIIFSATNTKTGSISIDDVVALDGPCPSSEEVCDFENDMCGYKGEWKRDKAGNVKSLTGLDKDHSTGSQEGHFVYIDTTEAKKLLELESLLYSPTPGRCLKFYYHNTNIIHKEVALEVAMRTEDGHSHTLDSLTGMDNENNWSFAEVNVYSGQYYQIVFSAYPGHGVIGLDDVQLSKSPCRDSYGCDFEEGLCAWRNRRDGSSRLDWQITSGHLPQGHIGPYKDVTLNTQFGHFLYLDTSGAAKQGDMAILSSQEMEYGRCLTFYYSMIGQGVGTLTVSYANTSRSADYGMERLWSKTGSQGKTPIWRKATVNIPATQSDLSTKQTFQLHIVGTVGSQPGADIGVDEIKVHMSRCSNVEDDDTLMIDCKAKSSTGELVQIKRSQICDFLPDCPDGEDEKHCGNCPFSSDGGWCEYVDESIGEITWISSRDLSDAERANIPNRPQDSPIDLSHGDFILVGRTPYAFSGQMLADLELDQYIGPSPPACQLHFSYFTSVMEPGHLALKVILRQSDEETVIFQADGFMASWYTADVDIGSIDSRFKIAFLGYKKFGRQYDGDVAIDDIQLRNCEFSPIKSSCEAHEFQCERGSCVAWNRVCDFTDDCGDQSDEQNCENRSVILRTSLEEGFGDWSVQVDKFTTPWLIQQGRDVQDFYGRPGRDHTLGTLNGHFMYFERETERSARLISPLLKAIPGQGKCHLRLHYFIYGRQNLKSLRIYSKTTLTEEKLILNKFTSHGQVWTRADIEIDEEDKVFQIVIEGTDGSPLSFLGLDDISVSNCELSTSDVLPVGKMVLTPSCKRSEFVCDDGSCVDRQDVHFCDSVNDCVDGTDEKNCGPCDFEDGLCDWHDESLGIFSWVLQSSTQHEQPDRDATMNSTGEGHFLLLQTHGAGVVRNDALLVSPSINGSDPSCQLSFSVFMNAERLDAFLQVQAKMPYVSDSNLYVNIPRSDNAQIKLGEWTRIKYNLGYTDMSFQLVIRYSYHSMDNKAFAIDDIQMENCKKESIMINLSTSLAPLECNFQNSFCQFHQTSLRNYFNWRITTMVGHKGESTGVATAVEAQRYNFLSWHAASFTSNWINGTETDLCMSFWYMTFGTRFQVALVREQATHIQVIFSHHKYEYTWQYGHATIPAMNEPFMIKFTTINGQHARQTYLSDLLVEREKCPPTRLCDFETDSCGYTTDNGRPWTRKSAIVNRRYPMPTFDHTTNDKSGHYLFVTETGRAGLEAKRMVSPVIDQPPSHDSCTYFWYHLSGPHVGQLVVLLHNMKLEMETQLWTLGGDQGDFWLQGRVQIPKNTGKYKLVFEALLLGRSEGSIAVDDIETIPGKCPIEGTCDFDTDMCGYTSHTFKADRAGETESRWLRLTSSYGISYFGPPSDHTQKHRNGGFAFSDQFLQEFSGTERTALLKSPVLRNTPVACVSFWYYFTGQAKGILRLRAHMGLFEARATFDGWRYSGPIPISSRKPYQISFESIRLTSSGASMAVDDVLVTEGQCSKHPVPASAPDQDPTEAPIPALIPHIPVPDKLDHNDRRKINCYAYCENWKTCYVLDKHSVKCVCQDEYIGNQCEIPRPPKKRNGDQQSFSDKKPQATKQPESDGWKTAVAIVFSLALVAVLAIIVFILLVRANRLHAPTLLQRWFPSLLSSSASQGGIENPVYAYSNSQNLEDAVVNPVYNSPQ